MAVLFYLELADMLNYSTDGNFDLKIRDVCTHTHSEKIFIILVCKNTVCALCTQYNVHIHSTVYRQRVCKSTVYTHGKYICSFVAV